MAESRFYGGTSIPKPVATGLNIVALCAGLRLAIAKAQDESRHLDVRILREQLAKLADLDALADYSLAPEA